MFLTQGKTALITGASSGIGEQFARTLASSGLHLILVARSQDKLDALAQELSQSGGIRAETIAIDLSQEGAAQTLYETVQQRHLTVDLLINNAGFGTHGHFETLSASREHNEVMLNVMAVVDLAHAFLPDMVLRGEGAIINVASTAAFQPLPYMAIYGASKAFVLSFSEALWGEYRKRGIRVLALCPGATDTPFFEVVGAQEAQFGRHRTTKQAVATALHALEQGRSYAIDGTANYIVAQSMRLLPRSIISRMGERIFRPRSSTHAKQQEQPSLHR